MKKATFLAAAIALLGFTSIDVNAQAPQAAHQAQQQTDNKEKISKEQLPEPVKAVLDHEAYKEWTVGDIFKVKPVEGAANAKTLYEISLTNKEGQTGTILLDETGKDASTEEQL
ncbi:hypothetical protein H9Q13_13445 [Pontibacter sp. JH31]|uniref:PepSY domain-containing protein n=2 Tax=Pontibacter aquaedesilientis TaxID=2766980 RepID=A0ABR7XKL0_9BACT|nr:hypothetical protein [Pontibacter aquaedesilientis]